MTLNFRHLDLNLLRVLAAVHRTGSVTAAGRQLALSQPAVSHALARLREFFGDALYVRSPTGLHPTRLAQRVAPAAIAHLHALEAALARSAAFDPASDHVHWRLSLSDLGEMLFLPPPLSRCAARFARAHRQRHAGARVQRRLESRDVDLAVGILARPIAASSATLFHEHYVAITASGWKPANGATGGA
jgi:DNA-binding transcriptional LysR family regulator